MNALVPIVSGHDANKVFVNSYKIRNSYITYMEVPSIYLNRVLAETAKKNGAELHLAVGSLPMARINKQLVALEEEMITSELLNKIIATFASQEEINKLQAERDLVLVKNFAGNFRFRVRLFYQKDLPCLSFHYIPGNIKSLADLKSSPLLSTFARLDSGLLIIAGPYGSGKTTTAAAFIEEINQMQSKSIITIEDPIEYLFVGKKSIVIQRQLGRDVKSVESALNYCLEEDVDAAYLSEIKNETEFISALPLIFELASGNCLVVLEINADSSVRVIEKILVAANKNFPDEAARYSLADILLAVFVQKLVPRRGGGLVLAQEVLLNSSATKSLIREGKIYQLESILQTSKVEGMVSLNKALRDLAEAGEIRPQDIG